MRADLHLHSSYSDGVCTPQDLLTRCQAASLNCIAITDHDTFAGSDVLTACAELPIELICGVELSLRDREGLHLLAYGMTDGEPLRTAVQRLSDRRRGRAAEMLGLLDALGIHLAMDEIAAQTKEAIGRPHIARAMVQHGYVGSVSEAFMRYLNVDGPAYVPTERLSMAEALKLIRESGFVSVLAHPCELNLPTEQLHELLQHYQRMGLMGVEAYHPSARKLGCSVLDSMVRPMGFLITGGSDFHQDHDKHGSIGCMIPEWQRIGEDLISLRTAMKHLKEQHVQQSRN